jgi:hypothetical protein
MHLLKRKRITSVPNDIKQPQVTKYYGSRNWRGLPSSPMKWTVFYYFRNVRHMLTTCKVSLEENFVKIHPSVRNAGHTLNIVEGSCILSTSININDQSEVLCIFSSYLKALMIVVSSVGYLSTFFCIVIT